MSKKTNKTKTWSDEIQEMGIVRDLATMSLNLFEAGCTPR
jgi:hypothetical protein